MRKFSSFAEFYPFYLGEHAKRATRRLHFLGSSLALLCLAALVFTVDPWWLAAALIAGYGFAWFAHLVFEKNRPATFRHPLYSLMGDWVMFWQILTGKIAF
ncbi:MAG: Mpo1-like protein [Rhizomicrobium sp.]